LKKIPEWQRIQPPLHLRSYFLIPQHPSFESSPPQSQTALAANAANLEIAREGSTTSIKFIKQERSFEDRPCYLVPRGARAHRCPPKLARSFENTLPCPDQLCDRRVINPIYEANKHYIYDTKIK
jgi:hypothetical protein